VLYLGTVPATLPAIFPAPYRYGGFAIGYNISTALFGGTALLVITFGIAVTGNDLVPAFYLIIAALVSIVPILSIPETAGVPIGGAERPGTTKASSKSGRR
jgi:MFS transporter, MHS family, proline/betaine transporter